MERGIQLMFKKRWPLNCKSPKEVHCHYRDLQLPSDWIHCKCHFSLCCHRSCPGISKLIQTECYLTTWDECHVLLPTSGDQMQKTSTTSSTIKHRLQHHATPVHSLSLLEKSQTIWSYTLFPSILVSRFLHAQDKKQNLHPNSVCMHWITRIWYQAAVVVLQLGRRHHVQLLLLTLQRFRLMFLLYSWAELPLNFFQWTTLGFHHIVCNIQNSCYTYCWEPQVDTAYSKSLYHIQEEESYHEVWDLHQQQTNLVNTGTVHC